MAKSRIVILAGVILLVAAFASGQEVPPNDALLAGIRELNAGNYTEAVSNFREAVDAQPQAQGLGVWVDSRK